MLNIELEITPKSINRYGKTHYYMKDINKYTNIKDEKKYAVHSWSTPQNRILQRIWRFVIEPKYILGYKIQLSYSFLYTRKQYEKIERKEKRKILKERKKQIKIEQQQLARLNEIFIPGLQYDKDTGIITSGNIPIIKDIENGYEQIYYENKQISSHRLIFKILNIDIKGYDVHHIDRNKRNNKFNNLQLLKRSEHMKLHSNMRNKKYGKMQQQTARTVP